MTGSRIHSRAGTQTEIRGAEETREACSATWQSPSLRQTYLYNGK